MPWLIISASDYRPGCTDIESTDFDNERSASALELREIPGSDDEEPAEDEFNDVKRVLGRKRSRSERKMLKAGERVWSCCSSPSHDHQGLDHM